MKINLCRSLFTEAAGGGVQLYQLSSCKFCGSFKIIFFIKHLRGTTSIMLPKDVVEVALVPLLLASEATLQSCS